MVQSSLPAQNQTFVNTRFKYTHGNGITLTPVSEFTHEGLPNLLVHGIPPISEHPELEVERPEIYYGMLTNSHVFATVVKRSSTTQAAPRMSTRITPGRAVSN
jgi:hypothetical protein